MHVVSRRLRSVADSGNQAQNTGVKAEPHSAGDKVEAAPGRSEEQTHRGYANAVLSDSALNNDV